MNQGKFITFEGGDGCGKSTQIKQTAAWLQTQGVDVQLTFEPGDTSLGKKIRQLLLDKHAQQDVPVPACELLLFLADRAQHVAQVIQPALNAGKWVLCDRYSDSTLAYQLAGRKLEQTGEVRQMLTWAEQGSVPDLTLWFDLPVIQAGKRLQARANSGEKGNRLDDEKQAFHQSVYQAFASIQQRNPVRMQKVNADQSIAQVQQDIVQLLQPLLAANK
ncbi:MAG: dTMP kinase [Ghiorsea sp.]